MAKRTPDITWLPKFELGVCPKVKPVKCPPLEEAYQVNPRVVRSTRTLKRERLLTCYKDHQQPGFTYHWVQQRAFASFRCANNPFLEVQELSPSLDSLCSNRQGVQSAHHSKKKPPGVTVRETMARKLMYWQMLNEDVTMMKKCKISVKRTEIDCKSAQSPNIEQQWRHFGRKSTPLQVKPLYFNYYRGSFHLRR